MPKPKPAGNAQRNAELAAIHIACNDAGMDEDDYRNMLFAVARVRSAADLDHAGRRKVLDHLRKLAGDEWGWVKTAPSDKQPMLWKIRRLCISLGIRRGGQVRYAEGAATRQSGHERHLRMMSFGDLYVLVGALNNTLLHKRLNKENPPA